MKRLIIFLFFLFMLLPVSALSQCYKYVDRHGRYHFTDDLGKIPESERSKAEPCADRSGKGPKPSVPMSQGSKASISPATYLHKAAEKGDIQEIKEVLSKGANVNALDGSGLTPLMYASYRGFKDAAELLIQSGADVNFKNRQGETALTKACGNNRLEMVRLLLAHGADVNAKARNGYTPLIIAAARSGPEVVLLLLDRGANINAKSEDSLTPLLNSLQYYDKKNALILISRGAKVNDKDGEGCTPLFHAVIRHHQDVVERLLEKGADINAKDDEGRTPLMYTPKYDTQSGDMAKLLLAKGADKAARDHSGLTASMHAAKLAKRELGELLTDSGYGKTRLMEAARNSDLKSIEQLIDGGSDINAKDTGGDSSLVYAVKANHLNAARLLIQKGADVNSRDINGMTSLMSAVGKNNREMVELLIQKGADVNANAGGMVDALTIAEWNGHKEIYELLKARGAKRPFTAEQAAAEPVEVTEKAVKAIWAGFCSAMVAGDLEKAANYIASNGREEYRRRLKELMKDRGKAANIFSNHEGVEFNKTYKPGEPFLNCGIIRNEGGQRYSYPIRFVRDFDGSWKIAGF
jgi:ankyrin repeat protein